jgi:serine/threonine-protein kinase
MIRRDLTRCITMNVGSMPGLLDALSDERLLTPEQFEEFSEQMLPICQEYSILAQELIYRGWLTPFQATQIAQGNIDSLFVGSYVLLDILGGGGMGQVYRARHANLKKTVAVKLLRDQNARDPAVLARFQREIRAMGQLNHPNIVMAFDAGRYQSGLYYAMEHVPGTDLGRYVVNNGPLSVEDACNTVMQTANALQYAYERGLVHRDVKPTNLLLAESSGIVKLLDLGLTRSELPADDSVFGEITRVGVLVGTPDYMSPEQIMDCRRVDIRSDLYSLGCTFYHLLVGQAPFADAPTTIDKLTLHCQEEPFPVDFYRPDVPPPLASLIHRLMAKRPRDRHSEPAEVLEELQTLQVNNFRTSKDTAQAYVTVPDMPALKPEGSVGNLLAPTEEFSASEMRLLQPTLTRKVLQRLLPESPFQRMSWVRLVIAVLLGTLGMLLLWGTGANRHSKDDSAPAMERNLPADDNDESSQEIKAHG